jgi:hypothetical protein
LDIRGYDTGPIACQAAFTADFTAPAGVTVDLLVNASEEDRPSMDVRPGMRHKYTPLRFDPADGTIHSGGRYLFDNVADADDYLRFTTAELELEPSVKFWDRPFFLGADKRTWRVVGAEDLMPIGTHFVSRLQRFTYSGSYILGSLAAVWLAMRDDAIRQGMASLWLLVQSKDRQLGIVTAAPRMPGGEVVDGASRSLAALEHSESLARFLPPELSLREEFDRTSLNVSLWLPKSREAGGDARAFPAYPLHPRAVAARSGASHTSVGSSARGA